MRGTPPSALAEALDWMAEHRGQAPALYIPPGKPGGGLLQAADYRSVSYQELASDSQAIGRGLLALGLTPGERVAVLVRPGLDLFSLSFGLLGTGLIPVLVDPGMGLRALGACLNEAAPAAFVGIPEAQLARTLFGWGRSSLRLIVTAGRRWGWGGWTLDEVRRMGKTSAVGSPRGPRTEDDAAVLFTSGSTGVPKGAVYTHGNFAAQVSMLRDTFGIAPGEVDLPTFPLFALFDPALGTTSVLPRMDFTRPAKVVPSEVIGPIQCFGVTTMFGSPALLDRVGRAAPEGVRLPSLRRVLSAGASVRPAILERFAALLGPDATIFTPYGATEALPVSVIDHRTILHETRARSEAGAGVCIGKPVDGVRVELIRIEDGPLPRWDDSLRVADGTVGELVVGSGSVTSTYLHRDEATRLSKILDGDQVLHRMGDVGWRDEQGRLWFCGRKSHRVRTAEGDLFTDPVEGVFDAHPDVRRTALVGVRHEGAFEEPVLCVEREPGCGGSDESLLAKLRELANQHTHTRGLGRMLVHSGAFPVDVRHNAKIFREALRSWAERRLA